MKRCFLGLSLLSVVITGCSSGPANLALGDFQYTQEVEGKALSIPENLKSPEQNKKFDILPQANDGPVGKDMDIRSPSLVLPIAASSRLEPGSAKATVWFDQVIDNKDLFAFLKRSVIEQLNSDNVELVTIDEQAHVYQSTWYNKETEDGFWFFSKVSEIENVKFNYSFEIKPHRRSVSITVDVVDFMKTNEQGATKSIGAVDKQRAEMNMLNSIIAQVDYNYRLAQHESRLARASQKLVTIDQNNNNEAVYVVEMELDDLWSRMPSFLEKHGFKVTDLNEPKKTYYVDYEQPENSVWASIWGNDVPVIEFDDGKYHFTLKERGEQSQQTEVAIYDKEGKALPLSMLEAAFPVVEPALSFRNAF